MVNSILYSLRRWQSKEDLAPQPSPNRHPANGFEPIPNVPTILELDPTLFHEIVGALLAIIIVAVALVYRRFRKPKGQVAK